MIAIIDYGVGNLFSLKSSLKQLGLEAVVTADADTIRKADRLILPGVGAFADAMAKLEATGLVPVIKEEAERKPLLGICLGMQLLFEKSYEYGEHEGLGFVKGEVCPLEPDLADKSLKVPQIGWNALHIVKDDPLFKYIREGEYVYYVHSYYGKNCTESTLAVSDYSIPVTGAVRAGRVYGTQFHPEKSGDTGLTDLEGVQRIVSGLALSGANAPAPPKGEPLAKPETLPYCQGLSLWERWTRAVRVDGEGEDAKGETTMQLFPAIDLRGGKVVRLTQGDYSRMTVYGEDPCAQAREFLAAGAKNLHVVDLDGAKDGTLSNYDTIAALAKQGGLYIEVGGGIRTEERIETYLSLGVGRCILGSVAVTDFAFTARMLKKYGDKIAVGVDAKDGYVAIHGWKEVSAEPGVDFCKRLADAGCTAIIYTDIACDGAMRGTNLGLYRTLAKEVSGVAFTASGGISSEAELLELKKMGTAAAILGKSLYTGALDLARCVQLVQE